MCLFHPFPSQTSEAEHSYLFSAPPPRIHLSSTLTPLTTPSFLRSLHRLSNMVRWLVSPSVDGLVPPFSPRQSLLRTAPSLSRPSLILSPSTTLTESTSSKREGLPGPLPFAHPFPRILAGNLQIALAMVTSSLPTTRTTSLPSSGNCAPSLQGRISISVLLSRSTSGLVPMANQSLICPGLLMFSTTSPS